MSETRAVIVAPDLEMLSQQAAQYVAQTIAAAVAERGRCTIALSGGSTPRGLYRLLAEDASFRARVDWGRTHLFWGDERCVPPDHPDSNYRMAFESLVSRVPVPEASVHRMRGEDPDPEQAARDYEAVLRGALGAPEAMPRLDLVLLDPPRRVPVEDLRLRDGARVRCEGRRIRGHHLV